MGNVQKSLSSLDEDGGAAQSLRHDNNHPHHNHHQQQPNINDNNNNNSDDSSIRLDLKQSTLHLTNVHHVNNNNNNSENVIDDNYQEEENEDDEEEDEEEDNEIEFFQICVDHLIHNHSLQLSNRGYEVFPMELLLMIRQEYERRLPTLSKNKKQKKQSTSPTDNQVRLFISHVSLAFNALVMFPYDAMIELRKMGILIVSEMDLTCAGLYNLFHIPKPVDSTDDDDLDLLNAEWATIFPLLTSFKAPGNHIQSFDAYLSRCKRLWEIDIGDNPCIASNEPFLPFVADESTCRIESLRFLKVSNCFNFLRSNWKKSERGDEWKDDHDNSDNIQVDCPESLLRLHCETLEILIAPENNITSFCKSVDDLFVMSQLRELILNDNRISELNPLVFNGRCLPALQTLVLMDNRLQGGVIEEIGTIKTLKRLYLGNNMISVLPESIGALNQLECLDCHNNLLTKLPLSMLRLKNMRYLDLTRNQITKLEDGILRNMDRLMDLYLAFNKLDNQTCSLSLIGKHMLRLKKLNISYNYFTNVDDLFASSKNAMSRLIRLLASGNKLTSIPIQLSRCPCLTHLYIGNNSIRSLSPEFLGNISERIKVLSLFGNSIADNQSCIDQLVSFGEGSIVDISHNNFNPNGFSVHRDHWIDVDNQHNRSDIDRDVSTNESISYGHSHMLGDRPTNEDSWFIDNNMRFDCVPNLHVQLFAVFDGHGGEVCAQYSSANIAAVLASVFKKHSEKAKENNINMLEFGSMIIRCLIKDLDHSIRQQRIQDGCTAVISLVLNHKYCICANVGDARGVLVSQQQDGSVVGRRVTVDHKANEYEERRRVMDLGGCTYEGRINGYSLSRALGDHDQRPLISCDPYVYTFEIDPSVHQFLILACDGVWDMVTDQMASQLVHDTFVRLDSDANQIRAEVQDGTRIIHSHVNNEGAKAAMCAAVLRDFAYALRSMDNISVIVCKFNQSAVSESSEQLNLVVEEKLEEEQVGPTTPLVCESRIEHTEEVSIIETLAEPKET